MTRLLPHPLASLQRWRSLKKRERLDFAKELASSLGPKFLAQSWLCGEEGLAQVLLKDHDLLFAAIPGGTFQMGISRAELKAALALRFQEEPETRQMLKAESTRTRQVVVNPFLCARSPLGEEGASTLLGREVEADEPGVPLRFGPGEAARLWKRGAKLGLRLLSSAEWEYVVREGGPCGWVGGRTAQQCERAHAALYNAEFDVERQDAGMTAWGIWGLPWGDWVADQPDSRPAAPKHTRGGWAMSYPWQSDEIAGCLSGQVDSAGLSDACVRLALGLPAGHYPWARAASRRATARASASSV